MVQLEENGLLPGIYRLYFIYMTQDNPIHHHTSPLHSTPLSTNARGTTAALTSSSLRLPVCLGNNMITYILCVLILGQVCA